MKNKLNILVLLLVIQYAKVVITAPLQDELPPECKTLNFETVESYPDVIEVNDKQFVIQGQIQHGATSRVFHAFEQHDNSPKRCMAIKVIDLDKIEHNLKNQATNEAKILGELNSKNVERVPKLFEIEQHPTKKTISMVMELAHHDLFDEITPNMGRGKHEWVRNTLKEILQAIHPLHQNGIVHGDLKPENMAYFRSPRTLNTPSKDDPLILKVIDFGGVIKNEELPKACEEIVTGTVMYMSPEQVAWCAARDDEEFMSRRKHFPLSKKSDVWSIGIILYQMLFGHSPYSWITKKYEHLDEIERGEKTDIELRQTIFDGKKPIEFDENYKDLAILDIVKRCLNRNPDKRPEIEQILEEMEKLESKVEDLEKKIEGLEKMEEKINQMEEEKEEREEKLEEENNKKEEEKKILQEEQEQQQMAAKQQFLAAQTNWQQYLKNLNFGGFNNGYFPLQIIKQGGQNVYGQNVNRGTNNMPHVMNIFPPKMITQKQKVFPKMQIITLPDLLINLKNVYGVGK